MQFPLTCDILVVARGDRMENKQIFDQLWEEQYQKVQQWSEFDWMQIPDSGYSMTEACERYPQFARARQQQFIPMGMTFSWNQDWITRDELVEFFNQAYHVYYKTCRLIIIVAQFQHVGSFAKYPLVGEEDFDYALIDHYEQYLPLFSSPLMSKLLAEVKETYILTSGKDFFRKQQLFRDIQTLFKGIDFNVYPTELLENIKGLLMSIDPELGKKILEKNKVKKHSY